MKPKIIDINNIDTYVKIINEITHDAITKSFIFRGQSNAIWDVESCAYCRLKLNKKILAPSQIVTYHSQIKDRKRGGGGSHPILNEMNDLHILSEIQHFGGATMLIDFTRSAFVALDFASLDTTMDGKVLCLKVEDINRFYDVSEKDEKKQFIKLLT